MKCSWIAVSFCWGFRSNLASDCAYESDHALVCDYESDYESDCGSDCKSDCEPDGVSVSDCETDGVSVSDCEIDGVSVSDCENDGVSVSDCEIDGVSVSDCENDLECDADGEILVILFPNDRVDHLGCLQLQLQIDWHLPPVRCPHRHSLTASSHSQCQLVLMFVDSVQCLDSALCPR